MSAAGLIVIELGILGPLVLRLDGEEVRLGPSLRVLVLALLCAREAPVPVGRLGVLLAEPGGKPVLEATVRSHVSHLRKVIGDHGHGQEPKVLVSARVGGAVAYALRHEVTGTDAARFDREVDEGEAELRDGRYASAGGVLRGALSLWRGAPLADAGDRPYARDWAAHLHGRHRHAVVLRAAASVGGLEHARVAGDLQGLVARWPDDEIVRSLHAITLYRSGRPARAAAACQDAIRRAQSHGLDSPRLHTLQRDVLNGTLPAAGLPHLPWGS
ncbi:MAG: AfsR/SARP family transcriptional regulator [Trebonia sp.]